MIEIGVGGDAGSEHWADFTNVVAVGVFLAGRARVVANGRTAESPTSCIDS